MSDDDQDMAQIIREAERDMARLEQEQEDHEQFLGTVSAGMSVSKSHFDGDDGSGDNSGAGESYVSGRELADQMARLRERTTMSNQPVELMDGPGMLHGQVQSARNLNVSRGTCDPFVKVSYVPPSEEEDTPSLMLRAKQKVHTTETTRDTAFPTWTQSTFNLEVEEPMTLSASGCDWDMLRGDLLFAVYDSNDGRRDEFIGQVIFPLRSLVNGLTAADVRGGSQRLQDVWCPLVGRRSNSSTVGEQPKDDEPALHLVMQLILPASTQQQLSPPGASRSSSSSSSSSSSTRAGLNANTPGASGASYQTRQPSTIEEAVAMRASDDDDVEEEEEEYATRNGSGRNASGASGINRSTKEQKKLRRRLKKKKKGSTKTKVRSKFETANRIEQARIAKENLITQKHLQHTRHGAGAGYGKVVEKTKAQQFMEESSRQARDRMKKRLEKDNEFVYGRIHKMRGEIQPKPPTKEAWELDDEDRQEKQDQVSRDQKESQRRYRIAADLTQQLEQLRSEASTLKDGVSLLQTKAQRYETGTRRARKLIEDANISKINRETALSKGRSNKKGESSLPPSAKSLGSLVPGSKESEFTKRFGRSSGSGGSGSGKRSNGGQMDNEEDDNIDYERLDELRGELAERLQSYEMVESRRKRYIDQAKKDREIALQLEIQLAELEGERDKMRARREWTAKYSMDAAAAAKNNENGNDIQEGKTSSRGGDGRRNSRMRSIRSSDRGIDVEHEKLLDAKSKLTAVQIDVSALEFELDDLKREHSYDIDHVTTLGNEMETNITRKQLQLKDMLLQKQELQDNISTLLKSGYAEKLQVQIRNMRNAELLCRHAAKNQASFENEAKTRVKRSKQSFDKKLKTRDAVDHHDGYSSLSR